MTRLVVRLVLVALSWPGASVLAATYGYLAETEGATALRQGEVRAGGIAWRCKGSRCTTSGPWPKPGVGACKALAQVVGRIRSYGHTGASLGPAELGACNEGLGEAKGAPVSTEALVRGGPAAVHEFSAELGENARQQGDVIAGVRWSCGGTRCSAPASQRRNADPLELCTSLAWRVGRVQSFSSPGGRLGPEELAACNIPRLQSIDVAARSGEDDLRRNSRLLVELVPDSTSGAWEAYPLFERGLGQHVRATMPIYPEERFAQHLVRSGLRRVKLEFRSGKTGDFDTADNWDMVELVVRAQLRDLDGREREVTLVDLRGSPVHRFRDRDEWEANVPPGILR